MPTPFLHMWRNSSFSLTSLLGGAVGVLIVVYIGLIAVVMSYAALTIEFSQSVRDDEAEVAALEERYFSVMSEIMQTDYAAENYAAPTAKIFVREKSVTALR